MEHGLEYITFYVEKHMAYLAVCSGPLPVRDQAIGKTPVRIILWCSTTKMPIKAWFLI